MMPFKKTKSPFMVYKNFLSPIICESIVDKLNFILPDTDPEGNFLPYTKYDEKCEKIIFDRLKFLTPQIEKYYDIKYKGTEHINFSWYPITTEENLHCENSEFLRKKWVRTRARDFTGIIFFSDYNEKEDFDTEYEVYGGKIEFPQHGFSLNPERGTLVIFPSGPHFINSISPINVGDLYFAKFHIASQAPYLHDPEKFPGTFQSWFAGL